MSATLNGPHAGQMTISTKTLDRKSIKALEANIRQRSFTAKIMTGYQCLHVYVDTGSLHTRDVAKAIEKIYNDLNAVVDRMVEKASAMV